MAAILKVDYVLQLNLKKEVLETLRIHIFISTSSIIKAAVQKVSLARTSSKAIKLSKSDIEQKGRSGTNPISDFSPKINYSYIISRKSLESTKISEKNFSFSIGL